MVIGNDHPHPHNGKYAPYVEVCGPQGPIFEYKGAVFFLAIKATTWLWFGMVICIHHPHIHNGKYTPYVKGQNTFFLRGLILKKKSLPSISLRGLFWGLRGQFEISRYFILNTSLVTRYHHGLILNCHIVHYL